MTLTWPLLQKFQSCDSYLGKVDFDGVLRVNQWLEIESPLWEISNSNNSLTESDTLSRLHHFSNLVVEVNLEGNDFNELNGLENVKMNFPKIRELRVSENKFFCDKLQLICR